MRLPTLSAIALISLSSIVVAQQADTVRVRGTIESSDHQLLSVKARDGEMLKVKLADNAPVPCHSLTALRKQSRFTSFQKPCGAPAKVIGHGISYPIAQ